MIQAIDDAVSTLQVVASLVIYAVLMVIGFCMIAAAILIYDGGLNDGPTDPESGTSTGQSAEEIRPGTAQRKGQDAE